ncbi:hypothetical protein D9611_011004 [Ephemerocybe angulata]|uniref:Rad60/SUMO-like domain-containing protein n=1 Tax=Ephemerocybe angulata TaxID=980116 RepID=A0A8H5BD44_9AGAR|nr:hypothetical protein D9611_011004 [Tulosesus angulatus]
MSDAASRPRPRPRPRPVPKTRTPSSTTAETSQDGASSSAAGPSTPKKALAKTEAEIDAMFMKNKNRSLKTWHKLEEINKDDESNDVGSNSDSDDNVSPRSRKRARKRVEALPVPKWQKDAELLRMLSAEPESDSDSDVVELDDEFATPNASKRDAKRKRQPSRSRSITPPPMIPQQQVENVKRFVQQALGEAKSRREQTAPQESPEHSRQPTPAQVDEDDAIQITVLWKPHPLDAAGEEIEWKYKINRSDSFQELFEAVAEDASIRVESLVVCYDGKRIFASVGPSALNIWTDVEFTAYSKPAFDYIRSHPELRSYSGLNTQQPQTQAPPSSSSGSAGAIELSDSDEDGPAPVQYNTTAQESQSQSQSRSQSHAGGADSDEEDNKFKLILRSALTGNKDISLTVRPTTKCGSILKAFLKKAGLEAQYPQVFADTAPAPAKPKRGRKAAAPAPAKDPRLCVDGDKLDNESPISEADLEDGDMVEVVGL